MSIAELALALVAGLGLYVMFSTQVMSRSGGHDRLPGRIRTLLAPTRPRPGAISRTAAILVSAGLAVAGQAGPFLILATQFESLSQLQLLMIGTEVTLAGLWTAYLVELRRRAGPRS